MARYNQKRKRSSGPFRSLKKSSVTRKKPRTSYINSVNGRVTSTPFSMGRKMRPKKYRNILWNATMASEKYNLNNTIALTVSTPASLVNYTYVNQQMFVGLDDITKYTNSNGANPTATIGKVTMRGGYSKFTLSSKEDEVVDYRLYAIWVKPNGVAPAAGALGKSIDIAHSATDTSNESVKIIKQWSGLLDRSQSASFFFRAKIKQYDTTLFTAGTDCMYWYLGVGNTIDATAVSVSYIQSFNCSMTMDVTA